MYAAESVASGAYHWATMEPNGDDTMNPSKDFDAATQCPDCGAQLVVNLRGHRQFACGREDIYLRDDERPGGWYIDPVKPCRTSEIAARMTAAEKHKLN